MTREHENDRDPKWKIDELADEASLTNKDEIQRRTLRGDETKGDPDERDHAGAADSEDTPQGSEEREKAIEKERKQNDG